MQEYRFAIREDVLFYRMHQECMNVKGEGLRVTCVRILMAPSDYDPAVMVLVGVIILLFLMQP